MYEIFEASGLLHNEFEEGALREDRRRQIGHKTRIKWVKDGECNSRLFHKFASRTKCKSFIKNIEQMQVLLLMKL